MARRALSGCLTFGAVAVAVGYGGGYDSPAQWIFAGLALAGAVVAAARRGSLSDLATPVALSLTGLAGLGTLSALWTIGPPSDALRWAAVTGGYAAVVVAARLAFSAELVAGGLVAAAAVTGMMGLVSATLLSSSFAERIEGGWRPEGPFGYGPALALVQVFALPALLTAMVRLRAVVAGLAAAGAVVAAGVLALDANRTAIALATLVAAIALAVPAGSVQSSRRLVALALLLAAAAGLGIHAAAGGWHGRHAHASGAALAAVLAIVAAAAPAWVAVRRLAAGAGGAVGGPAGTRWLAVGVIAAVAAVAVGLGTAGSLSARRFTAHDGFTHGRTWMWRVAANAGFDRPFGGSGAGTFLRATYLDQPGYGRITRFAHDLPLETAVELGAPGFLLALALYAATVLAAWRARWSRALWLAGPAAIGFLVSNAVDWTWHLAGIGALFAAAAGVIEPARRALEERS